MNAALKFAKEYRTAIIIVIVAVILIVLVKKLKKTKEDQLLEAENKSYITAIQNKVDKNDLSYDGTEYRDMADQLFEAFNGPGTNDKLWREVFNRMKTDADVNQLIVAFGSRKPTTGGFSFGRKAETLAQWIAGDLSANQRKELNNMLHSKGITKTF
jgi:hypothetical protein